MDYDLRPSGSSFAQNIWNLLSLVSVEFRRGQHGKAWTPPNTLGRILARILHAQATRMARRPLLARLLHAETTRTARCPSPRANKAKTKNSGANRACIRVPATVSDPPQGGYKLFLCRRPAFAAFGVANTVNGSQSRATIFDSATSISKNESRRGVDESC